MTANMLLPKVPIRVAVVWHLSTTKASDELLGGTEVPPTSYLVVLRFHGGIEVPSFSNQSTTISNSGNH